jgi:hypothetical protein
MIGLCKRFSALMIFMQLHAHLTDINVKLQGPEKPIDVMFSKITTSERNLQVHPFELNSRILACKGINIILLVFGRSRTTVHSRRRDSVNKPSPVSPQLTARSGQSAHLLQRTHCIRTHVNLHSDFGHPCNGTRFTWLLLDFILRAKEISRAFVYDAAKSGKSAQLVQCTHCIRTHVNLHSDFGHPATVHTSRDRCMVSF